MMDFLTSELHKGALCPYTRRIYEADRRKVYISVRPNTELSARCSCYIHQYSIGDDMGLGRQVKLVLSVSMPGPRRLW